MYNIAATCQHDETTNLLEGGFRPQARFLKSPDVVG